MEYIQLQLPLVELARTTRTFDRELLSLPLFTDPCHSIPVFYDHKIGEDTLHKGD